MGAIEPLGGDPDGARAAASGPGGLLDVLKVAAVLLDADGRIDLWSPQAEDLFGYTAEEALGEFAGRLLVHEEQLPLVMGMFAQVMAGGPAAPAAAAPAGSEPAAPGGPGL
ncbi:PAS domain-containing protein, partial [Streptomyces sp. NPDC041003]|uniref:PAS domain-containing protein n=1 Tax=Streptomyces sp. NPDC041003 TaxID=3155730 RepID=UPI0033D39ABC